MVAPLNWLNQKKWRWLAVVGLAAAVFALWLVPGLGAREGPSAAFRVASGESRRAVAARLQAAGIIRSPSHFLFLSFIEGRHLLAGTFTLSPAARLPAIVAALSSKDKIEQAITIPEGWRREQIADALAQKGVDRADFMRLTTDLEGTLFPDTYYLKAHPTAEGVVVKMTDNFQRKTAGLNLTRDQLIVASIVEREAKRDEERAIIAGIFLGRLAEGARLEADPTVQYGRDSLALAAGRLQTFWAPISVNDYTGVASAYNSYLHDGLPPAPICNPGLKSIIAAASSPRSRARYFFHTKDGTLVTSVTKAEHNANKAKYLK